MLNITVFSREKEDSRVLYDLLRAHFPGCIVETADPGGGSGGEKKAVAVSPDGKEMTLCVQRDEKGQAIKVQLAYRGLIVEHLEPLPEDTFDEPLINRRRRQLRLAVYKTLARFFALEEKEMPEKRDRGMASPWGVLTGVRPTKIVHRLIEQGYNEERIMLHLTRDYGMSAQKAGLVTNVALVQRPYLLSRTETQKKISLYLGIPFCPTRCHYCSFPSYAIERWGKLLEPYLEALQHELSQVAALLKREGVEVQSVYVGGGTPSILTTEQLTRLLAHVKSSFCLVSPGEITVEGGRPDTLDLEKIATLKRLGMTRISINPQTMHETTLEAIGRRHRVRDIVEVYGLARQAQVAVVNMDLIVGLPGEDPEMLEETLQQVTALAPENITVHALAIKRAARYGQERIGLYPQADGVAGYGAVMMVAVQAFLEETGYIPYYLYRQKEIFAHGENVGYGKAGTFCFYNIQMMEERQTILGFGVGAGSKIINPRNWAVDNFYNPKDLTVYLARLEEIIQRKVDKLMSFVYNNC